MWKTSSARARRRVAWSLFRGADSGGAARQKPEIQTQSRNHNIILSIIVHRISRTIDIEILILKLITSGGLSKFSSGARL
jgi:hypothetical protein